MIEHHGSCHCGRVHLVLRDEPTEVSECKLLDLSAYGRTVALLPPEIGHGRGRGNGLPAG